MSNFRRRLMMSIKKKEKFDDFQELEYIESTGTQYIDTGILAKKNIQIETEIEVTTKQQDIPVFGYYKDYTSFNSNGNYYHLTPYRNKWYFGKNGIEGSANIYKGDIGMKYNIIFNDINGAIIINNEILCTNEIFEAPDANIAISKRGSKAKNINGKFKYFYFNVFDKDENKVIREFLPCYATTTVTDVDGEQCLAGTVGLYDTVNGQFYTNQGTGTFLYGEKENWYVSKIYKWNNIEYANNKQILKYKDKQVINPKDENFIEAGYKELIETEEPSYNLDTEYLQVYYEEKENKIFQKYKVLKLDESGV